MAHPHTLPRCLYIAHILWNTLSAPAVAKKKLFDSSLISFFFHFLETTPPSYHSPSHPSLKASPYSSPPHRALTHPSPLSAGHSSVCAVILKPRRVSSTESLHKCMSVQNEEELRNVWVAGWEARPSLLTGWGARRRSGWVGGWGCCRESGERRSFVLKDSVDLFGSIYITWYFTWMFRLRCASPEGPMFFCNNFECNIKTPFRLHKF